MTHEEPHKHTHEHECCDHEHSHGHDHCGCHEHGREHEHGHGHGHEDGCGCGHDHGAGADRGAVIRLIVSAGLFVLSLIPQPHFWVTLLLSIAAVLPVGIPVLLEAVEEWKDRRIGENTLLLVALPAAFAIGEYREGAMVALLFALGELLEDLAVGRSNRALTALAEIRPENTASIRVAERLGMRPAGMMRKVFRGRVMRHRIYLLRSPFIPEGANPDFPWMEEEE